MADSADLVQPKRPGNILTRGRVIKGDAEAALAVRRYVVEGEFETGFVEHAYIEPEAGFARRVGDRLELAGLHASALHEPRRYRQAAGYFSGAGAHLAERGRRRLRLQARHVGAALHRAGGLGDQEAGAHGLYPAGIDHVHHQAPPLAHPPAHRRVARRQAAGASTLPATSTPAPTPPGGRRWQTACPCMRRVRIRAALPGADPRHSHASRSGRRLPRLRRAPGDIGAGALFDDLADKTRHRSSRVPHPERSSAPISRQ